MSDGKNSCTQLVDGDRQWRKGWAISWTLQPAATHDGIHLCWTSCWPIQAPAFLKIRQNITIGHTRVRSNVFFKGEGGDCELNSLQWFWVWSDVKRVVLHCIRNYHIQKIYQLIDRSLRGRSTNFSPKVAISHKVTPKLQTSDFSEYMPTAKLSIASHL